MKKSAFAVAALLAVCACTKDEINVNDTHVGAITFTATMDAEADTKAQIGEENCILWSDADSISVLDINDNPANSKFVLASGAGKTTASFPGTCPLSTVGYYAVYPYSSKTYLERYSENKNYPDIWWDGSAQTAYGGKLDPAKHIMVASGTINEAGTEIPLAFKNVLAYLKFTIKYKCKSVVIQTKDADDYIACEHFEVMMDSEGNPATSSISSRTDKITLTAPDGGIIEPGTYYVGILPKTYSNGFCLTFNSATVDGKSCNKSTPKSCTFERNKVYNLGTIDLSEIIDLAGSGKKDDPYLITDISDLNVMQMRIDNNIEGYASAYYLQTKDLDFEGQTFKPMAALNHFSGTYDGGTHTISNIVYTDVGYVNDTYCYALFCCIEGATIQNLTIDNADIKEPEEDLFISELSPLVAFAIGEEAQNIIQNCHVTASSGKAWTLNDDCDLTYGGIVARNGSNLTILNCSSDIDLDIKHIHNGSSTNIGGLVGFTQGGCAAAGKAVETTEDAVTVISQCRNTGDITYDENNARKGSSLGYDIFIGGLLGQARDFALAHDVQCIITASVNSGDLELLNVDENTDTYLGGIVGKMDSDGFGVINPSNPRLQLCLNKGSLKNSTADSYVGGIMGWCSDNDTKVSYCVNTGTTNVYGYSMYYCSKDSPSCTSCFTTNSWGCDTGCTVKSDLTAEYLNNLNPLYDIKWITASDSSLDLKF